MAKRYLSKSRFKLGSECPTKLYFGVHKEYADTKVDNSFLKSLAEGGFQVGELAKLYYPGGHEITTLDYDQSVKETETLLAQDNVIIYEAALLFENLFVRVDILKKTGNSVQLIEVKSKSIDPEERGFYTKKTGKITSKWEPYFLDVAFQTHVLKKAHPEFIVKSFLMLADKTAAASVEGLNQNFILESKDGRSRAKTKVTLTAEQLGTRILEEVDVSSEIQFIFDKYTNSGRNFLDHVNYLSEVYKTAEKASGRIGADCKKCEFRGNAKTTSAGLKNGFEECWSAQLKLKPKDFIRPFAFEIWDLRKTDEFLSSNVIFMDQVTEDSLLPKTKSKPKNELGLSRVQRQWLQVKKSVACDPSPYIDVDGLKELISTFQYPLNFIDFETTMVAIPFNSGRKPYEQIAFQFSHHILNENGEIQHKTQFINSKRGMFPNFEFLRALKTALETNKGTIFRYAPHENTVLRQIHRQLQDSNEVDKADLCAFIEHITTDSDNEISGQRTMVDLCEMVKKYYYSPLMKGSNSIKQVLPAILNSSEFLQKKYSKPVYGDQISSLNFSNWAWIQFDESKLVIDPYKLLPEIFSDLDLETMDSLIKDNSIADGGAAMTAYARMQFTEMSQTEVDRVTAALLKYCELDTFAMVMIFEYWAHEIQISSGKGKRAA